MCAHTLTHTPTHTGVLDLMSLLTIFLIHLSLPGTHNTVTHTHTHFLYDQSTSNSNSFKYSYKVLEDGWSASRFPPLSLFLSPGILIIPPVSPPHRVGGFFPSDKVSRSFYKLIRVCSLWSRQLWTRRIDLAGESAVPDHDFKQNPMFLWRGRPSPEQYPYYPSIWLVQSEGGWWWWWWGGTGRKYLRVVEEVKTAEVGFWS